MAAASSIAIAAAAFPRSDPRLDPSAGIESSSLSPPDLYEALLGRKLKPTPPHLTSRVLYVPSHNHKAAHLPIYDFTQEFRAAVGDEPVGSIRFKTKFGLMAKPIGDGRGAGEVSYLIDFEPLEARHMSVSAPTHRRKSSLAALTTRAAVQRRSLYGGGAEVGLTIPPLSPLGAGLDDGAVACTMSPRSMTLDIPLVTSFPISPTVSKFASSRNPWYTFTVPNLLDGERTLQWQIHPVEQGMLRYTLVELPVGSPAISTAAEDAEGKKPQHAATEDANEHLIRAIYHNVGLGFSLSQPWSEGALLLQSGLAPELEAVIVGSLLGLLWRMRNEESKPQKASKPDTSGKPARHGRRVDGEAPASPGKRLLFGKILGRK